MYGDRSCGTHLYAGEKRAFVNGKTGSELTGTPMRVEPYGCYDKAVVVEVCGRGYYTGEGLKRMTQKVMAS